MKTLLLIAMLVVNSFALDALGALDEDNKKVLNKVLKKLDLSNASPKIKEKVYAKFSFSLEKNWYIKWWDNATPSATKIENSQTKFIEMTVIDENRIYSFTFINFKAEQQLFVIARQYVPTDSDALLKRFSKLKEDPEYKLNTETENYASLTEKNYMSDTIIHIKNKYGIIAYIDMTTLDLAQ